MFAVSSDYAYGIQGVPPAVLANEPLTFDVTALEYRGNIQTSASFASDAPLTPRTPGSIKAEFERRQAEKAVRASSDRALRDERDAEASPLDQVKNAFGDLGDKFFGDEGFYFFGFFESATGEEAPWYLKPYLTFPAIFLGVALSFYGLLQTDVIVLRGDNSPIPGQQGQQPTNIIMRARNVVASKDRGAARRAPRIPASRSNAISPAAGARRAPFSIRLPRPDLLHERPHAALEGLERLALALLDLGDRRVQRLPHLRGLLLPLRVGRLLDRLARPGVLLVHNVLELEARDERVALGRAHLALGRRREERPEVAIIVVVVVAGVRHAPSGWASNRLLSWSGSSAASRIRCDARGCWNAVAPPTPPSGSSPARHDWRRVCSVCKL